uniref:Uncharacterized protein n=1 Tax=Oryza barthii TaxID=65489 RepID=A0A0D3F8S1_9ORYZ
MLTLPYPLPSIPRSHTGTEAAHSLSPRFSLLDLAALSPSLAVSPSSVALFPPLRPLVLSSLLFPSHLPTVARRTTHGRRAGRRTGGRGEGCGTVHRRDGRQGDRCDERATQVTGEVKRTERYYLIRGPGRVVGPGGVGGGA